MGGWGALGLTAAGVGLDEMRSIRAVPAEGSWPDAIGVGGQMMTMKMRSAVDWVGGGGGGIL